MSRLFKVVPHGSVRIAIIWVHAAVGMHTWNILTYAFHWEFSSRIAVLWIFRRYVPILLQPSSRSGPSTNSYLMVVIRIERSTLRHGMGMCIANSFVASHLLFGPVKHFLYWEFLYFHQNINLFQSLCLPFLSHFRALLPFSGGPKSQCPPWDDHHGCFHLMVSWLVAAVCRQTQTVQPWGRWLMDGRADKQMDGQTLPITKFYYLPASSKLGGW